MPCKLHSTIEGRDLRTRCVNGAYMYRHTPNRTNAWPPHILGSDTPSRYLKAPSQQMLPEIDYGGLDEPPPDYEPPNEEDFVIPEPGEAITARTVDSEGINRDVHFNVCCT